MGGGCGGTVSLGPLLRRVGAGADGLLVEIHPDPENALSDGDQSLSLEEFGTFMESLRPSRKPPAGALSRPGRARDGGMRRRGEGGGLTPPHPLPYPSSAEAAAAHLGVHRTPGGPSREGFRASTERIQSNTPPTSDPKGLMRPLEHIVRELGQGDPPLLPRSGPAPRSPRGCCGRHPPPDQVISQGRWARARYPAPGPPDPSARAAVSTAPANAGRVTRRGVHRCRRGWTCLLEVPVCIAVGSPFSRVRKAL